MAFNFGFGFSKSSSQARQESGLRGHDATAFSGSVLPYAQNFMQQSQNAYNDPFGYFQGQHYDQLFPTNEYGMAPETTGAVNSMIGNALNRFSGNAAMRGQMSPMNQGGIAGGAIQNVLPQLLPMIQQYSIFRRQAPEQLRAGRLAFLGAPLQTAPGLLGSQGSSSSNAFGFNTQGGYGV